MNQQPEYISLKYVLNYMWSRADLSLKEKIFISIFLTISWEMLPVESKIIVKEKKRHLYLVKD